MLKRGRIPPSQMALTTVEPPAQEAPEVFAPPPDKIVTPCDPWPRPYYLEDGLRRVKPYHFTYNTYCKQRWRGREILDIFQDEFRDRTMEYYVCVGEKRWRGYRRLTNTPRGMRLRLARFI